MVQIQNNLNPDTEIYTPNYREALTFYAVSYITMIGKTTLLDLYDELKIYLADWDYNLKEDEDELILDVIHKMLVSTDSMYYITIELVETPECDDCSFLPTVIFNAF